MTVERKVNPTTNVVELWYCEWEMSDGKKTKKKLIEKIGDEQPLLPLHGDDPNEVPAICWAQGRTLGNIAVSSPSILGSFSGDAGNDARLPCEFVHAGKYRHGAERWWCRIHQTHWGIKADLEAQKRFGHLCCANHEQLMSYVLSPLLVQVSDYKQIEVRCSFPAALASCPVVPEVPKISVRATSRVDGTELDTLVDALAIGYGQDLGLFENNQITRVNVTPPAAFEFVCAQEEQREMSCINCSSCHYPHLDLAGFAEKPHRKHFCGNCGRDSTWSKVPIVSTPLKPLHDRLARNSRFEPALDVLDLDRTLAANTGAQYEIRASAPAIIWTADQPQKTGIDVRVVGANGKVLVSDIFGKVSLDGRSLERPLLFETMRENVLR